MDYKDVFDITKGEDNLVVTRLAERQSWMITVHDACNTSSFMMDRKNMKDLIQALEVERYASDKKPPV